MTIHAAKGLEFESVFLPELAEPITVRREDVLTDGSKWLALQKTLSSETPKLFLSTYLGNIKKERAMSEEKRVLYVAMTRCRDALYLSATEGRSRQKDSFYGWILPHLDRLPIERRYASSRHETEFGHPEHQPFAPAPAMQVALHDSRFENTREQCRGVLSLNVAPKSRATTPALMVSRVPFAPVALPPGLSPEPAHTNSMSPADAPVDFFPDLLDEQSG
jgi:hypothetical protein